MKLTEAVIKRMNYLIGKALDKNEDTLNEAEIKELRSILLRINEVEKEAKEAKEKTSLSEVIDLGMNKALCEMALKKNEKAQFDKLPLGEKFSQLKQDVEKLQNSPSMKALLADKKEQDEKEAFEEFYRSHTEKHGRSR
jgi:hypothetical protein